MALVSQIVLAALWTIAPCGTIQHCVEAPTAKFEHVRSSEAAMVESLREGWTRSATFRRLIEQLNQSETIVYIERGICGFGHYRACLPHWIAIRAGVRYIRILIDPTQRGERELALIAHELQHALEIAQAPGIRTADDITELFRRIGRSPHCPLGTPDCYETSAALAAGVAVLREVSRSRAAGVGRSRLPAGAGPGPSDGRCRRPRHERADKLSVRES
jgi:hypothetical protein